MQIYLYIRVKVSRGRRDINRKGVRHQDRGMDRNHTPAISCVSPQNADRKLNF
jgi:hypothetical protein